MDPKKTALVLIGFQNDWFHEDGILRPVIKEQAESTGMLPNTLELINQLQNTGVTIFSSPILFREGYPELVEPMGVLAMIKKVGAFQIGRKGSETIDALAGNQDVIEIRGRRGLNAFSNTVLETELSARGIEDIVLAGVVTSLCLDSTARCALDLDFRVHILQDCISGRTDLEHQLYCDEIFPMFCGMTDSKALVEDLQNVPAQA
jgi:nicotinamidase-related amidase